MGSPVIAKVRFVQVQFHDFVPDSEARMDRIKEQLEATHRLDYFYKFVWESWTRKE